MVVALLVLLFTLTKATENALFFVPFEISFGNSNQFNFIFEHLESFIESSSTFFNISNDNITIAFIKELRSTNLIDVGFTVSAHSVDEEYNIRNIDIHLYRAYLLSTNSNLPHIIGTEMKYEHCANGKYSTFYHYDVQCQWLCDHLSIYRNETNECTSISNVSSTMYTTETNTTRFIYIGYGSSLLITMCFCIVYGVCICIKKRIKEKAFTKISKKESKPCYTKRESVYFYGDTENDDGSNSENQEMNKDVNDNQAKQNTENVNKKLKNIILSVGSTRSDSCVELEGKSALQSPTAQNEEIFCEATLEPLEHIECDEKLKKMKSMIIEEGRLQQFKILDNLEEMRGNIENEIDKQQIEDKQKLKSEYLMNMKKVMENSEMNEMEKDEKLTQIETKYKEGSTKLKNDGHDQKKNNISDNQHKIKEELFNIKSKTEQKLNDLIKDDDQNITLS